jgi:uncharacterized membrane protein
METVMSPFVAGALGALALVVTLGVLRRALRHRRLRRWGGGGPLPLRRLFAWLGARPEQEAVLAEVAEALRQDVGALRAEGRAAREAVAELFALDALDQAAVSAALDRGLGKLDELSARLAASLARVHATLDAGQRARVAELLRHGPGHGHRHHAHGRC